MFLHKLILLVVSLILVTKNVNSERILAMVMIPSYSHQMFYQPLWRELAIKGHDVVVITTDPTNEVLPNFKEIGIKESYPTMKKFLDEMINTTMLQNIWENKWAEVSISLTEFQFNLPQIQELIHNKSEHFDLLIIEHFPSPAFGLQYHFNCSMIGVVSLDAMSVSHEIMGNADHFILYPSAILPYQEDFTFVQRIGALMFGVVVNYMQYASFGMYTDLARQYFGKDMPPIGDIIEKTDMLFVNANPVFSQVRPYTPSTISIAGGMHMKAEKPLPKNLKDFLDNAKDGAIYFSLGSNVRSNELSMNLRKIIMETLAQVPYPVLWKFENDDLPGKPDNVMITKWAPQQDVLRHKNVKLFITQGGLQSLEESLYSHVPVVVLPFFGDQEANADKVNRKGMGVALDRHNLNVEDFKKAIFEVMENPSYRTTVKQMAIQIQDTPRTPLENAVWWIEYVLRHKGAQHLKGPRIPFYQYYYLDVIFVLGATVSTLIGLVILIVKYICRGICCLMKCNKTKTSKKEKLKKN